MSKAKDITTLTAEEQEFLAEMELQEAAKPKAMPMMKQLVINEDRVNDKGEKIEPDTWNIRGEGVYADKVDFQPLVYMHKFIRMVQDGKKWKTENESIFVPMPWDTAYDANGTVACGRFVGKVPESWTEAQKMANLKRATIYGFLFGLVTFPGKQPELVNFRSAPGKSKVIREALNTIGEYKLFQVPFTLKLTPPSKGDKFAALDMTAQLKNVNTNFAHLIPYIKECNSFIAQHNTRIMERRKSLETRLADTTVFNAVKSLADDFNDEIPFGSKGGIAL